MTRRESKRNYLDLASFKGLPGGEGCFYECLKCNTIIPSRPDDNTWCECLNIVIHPHDDRMGIKDKSQARYFCVDK